MGLVQNGLHGYGQHGHGQHPQQGRQICAASLPDAVVTFFNSNIELTSFQRIEQRSIHGAGSIRLAGGPVPLFRNHRSQHTSDFPSPRGETRHHTLTSCCQTASVAM